MSVVIIESIFWVASIGHNILAALWQGLRDTWVEAVVVALALHFYFLLSQPQLDRLRKSPQPKKAAPPVPPLHLQSGRNRPTWIGKRRPSAPVASATTAESGADWEAQRLVSSLLRSGNRCLPEVLEQYESLVRLRRVDLQDHVADAEHARMMYVALASAALRTSAPPPGPSLARGYVGREANARAWTTRLLADMRMSGFPRSSEFYGSLIKLHADSSFFGTAFWLYDLMVAESFPLDRAVLICLMNAAITCDDSKKALLFFRELCKQGPPSMRTYMTVLRIFTKEQDWLGAVNLLSRMKAAGARPDALVLNSALGLCISASELAAAEGLLQQWPDSTDVVSFNIMLKGCSQQADISRAEAILQRMLRSGPAPNLISFNTTMDCAVRALQARERPGQRGAPPRHRVQCEVSGVRSDSASAERSFGALARRPWSLLEELTGLGMEPDRYTCSTLVKGMHLAGCSAEDIDRAVALLRRIGKEGLHMPSQCNSGSASMSNVRLLEVLFNTLLDACVSIHDLDRMAEIFKLMESFSVDVSAVTYGTLIKAFGQAGQLSNCHEVWQRMHAAGVNPTVVTYGCYIDACVRTQDTVTAERVFRAMPQAGVRPNAVIFTSLIRGFAHARQPAKALELYRALQHEGIEANAMTFNSVLDVIVRQLADPASLREVIEDMRTAKIEPDVVTYSILIKASCSAGHAGGALELFRQIRAAGLGFDEVAFNTLLLACSKAEQVADAEEIFGEMRRLGMAPTHVTASILVKMYGRAKQLDKAIMVSEMIEQEYGIMPNLYVYTCLIQACMQNRQLRKSLELFNRMLRSGIMPDAITYSTIIHGCVYHNRFEQAMSLVRHAYMLLAPNTLLRSPNSLFYFEKAPVARPVHLQQEALRVLLAALQRKELQELVGELELIMQQQPFAKSHVFSVGVEEGLAGRRTQRRRQDRPSS